MWPQRVACTVSPPGTAVCHVAHWRPVLLGCAVGSYPDLETLPHGRVAIPSEIKPKILLKYQYTVPPLATHAHEVVPACMHTVHAMWHFAQAPGVCCAFGGVQDRVVVTLCTFATSLYART